MRRPARPPSPLASRLVARVALSALVALAACGDAGGASLDDATDREDADADAIAQVDGRADGAPGDVGEDAGGDADGRRADADVEVAPPLPLAVGRSVAARLVDGREVEGELVAIYDHRTFWFEPAARETWAVFDAEGLAEAWDEDASFTFVDAREVADLVVTELPAGRLAYRDALRELGLVLARSPLDGVAHVLMAGGKKGSSPPISHILPKMGNGDT